MDENLFLWNSLAESFQALCPSFERGWCLLCKSTDDTQQTTGYKE